MGWRLVLIEGMDRGHTTAGVPSGSLGTDPGLCCTSCLGHGGATGSSQGAGTVRTGAGCVPQAGTGLLGQAMAVSLLQLLPGALHLLPATGDHWPHSTSSHTPHPPNRPKRTKPDFKARPLVGQGQSLPRSTSGSRPMFFPCTVLHQPGNPQENRTCRAKELFPYASPPRSIPRKAGRRDSDTQGCRATAPTPQAGGHGTDLSLSSPTCRSLAFPCHCRATGKLGREGRGDAGG